MKGNVENDEDVGDNSDSAVDNIHGNADGNGNPHSYKVGDKDEDNKTTRGGQHGDTKEDPTFIQRKQELLLRREKMK